MKMSLVWMLALAAGCNAQLAELDGDAERDLASVQKKDKKVKGKDIFNKEEFDGNGRTCQTCHLKKTGTVSPEDIQDAFDSDPNDPLFRAIDSDDGLGLTYDRMLTDATFRVILDLPDNVTLAGDPSATQVVVHRGASATLNNPGLETIFMQDGRNLTLQEQALGAINAHYEPGRQPTEEELDAVAEHQVDTNNFYSSPDLRKWAQNGEPPPELPPGTTDAEIRGRVWFDGSAPEGVCAHCHDGDYLNETNEFLQAPLPPGSRFFTAFVSEFNLGNNEVYTFEFADPNDPSAPPVIIESPDPGLALQTGDPATANLFRIPTLWGAKDTAPYFHDNSAKNLEEVMQHYDAYFQIVLGTGLTPEEQADIVAYMQLLE